VRTSHALLEGGIDMSAKPKKGSSSLAGDAQAGARLPSMKVKKKKKKQKKNSRGK
jgi:hypothetical protein